MNILWDWRLFSTGYRNRGIGRYCEAVTGALLTRKLKATIYVWAHRADVPKSLQSDKLLWIPYNGGSWKNSIAMIPFLVIRYRIDLLHYWVALGPMREIGIAPFSFVPSVATIYDLGVELWDTPFAGALRDSVSWRMQKRFFRALQGYMAISKATLESVPSVFSKRPRQQEIVYMPQSKKETATTDLKNREPYFITLGGSAHKNCARVVAAFSRMVKKYPHWRLEIIGHIEPVEESLQKLPGGVTHEPSMDRYIHHLKHCSGLIFCSLYEGLGIPPLEAMNYGCPLLLSTIPALEETCARSGRFVDPFSIDDISKGIEELIVHNALWVTRSKEGYKSYCRLSADAPDRCLRMYERLSGVSIITKRDSVRDGVV